MFSDCGRVEKPPAGFFVFVVVVVVVFRKRTSKIEGKC